MKDEDLAFLSKFEDAKKLFFKVFRQAKKTIVIQDEDDFIDSMVDHLMDSYNLSEDDAEGYADVIYEIWEECGCSMTAFDREMTSLKEKLS